MPSLAPGARLGPYEIVAPIGAGGMGEVYKARDTRLDRTVALKVLQSTLASDPQFRERFDREARTISSLDHPHICALYDVGRERGVDFLVMQYLEGETLDARLERGALPIDQALGVARQIANALDKAHRQGIVHRDLKPGNVMLSKARAGSPQVHLLDFGLAKTAPAVTAANAGQPTVAAGVTAEGTILGTIQYMAPEQIEGQEADARTDIFAFGCVLYEMLTAHKAFTGKTQASLLGAILKDPAPRVAERLPVAPAALDHIVATCLAKDPDERWQSAADLERELEWIAGTLSDPTTAVAAATAPRRHWPARLAIGALGVIAGAGLMWAVNARRAPPAAGVTRAIVPVSPADSLPIPRPYRAAFALSPDGRTLAFSGRQGSSNRLYVRQLDQLTATMVPGADAITGPFFSPDGKWIGYYQRGALWKVPIGGGPAGQICQTVQNVGATWSVDGTIIFSLVTGGLLRVPATGGKPEDLTKVDQAAGEISHRLPQALPDGNAVLFSIVRNLFDFTVSQVAVYDIKAKTKTVLIENAMDARYVESGHLIFARSGTMFAVPFDVRQRKVTGPEVGILNDVMQAANTGNGPNDTGAMQVAVSATGLMASVPGGVRADQDRALVWIDRAGKVEELPLPVAEYAAPRLSPDGKKVALDSRGRNRAIWVYDLERGTTTAIAREGTAAFPVWSPDGTQLVFAANAVGSRNLFRRPADGTGRLERVTTSGDGHWPVSWTTDGTVLFVELIALGTTTRIEAVDIDRSGATPRVLLSSGDLETPAISPDGKWLAYCSSESGRSEVYVLSYPDLKNRQAVSTAGGAQPAWSRDGKQLFYLLGRQLFSVDVTAGPSLKVGIPKLALDLPQGTFFVSSPARGYDVSLDGKRFLATRLRPGPPEAPATAIQITLNWFEELRAKVK